MDKEVFTRVRIGEMYVKDFKIQAVKGEDLRWRVVREISLINDKLQGIPIIKEEAQALMGMLDKSAVLEEVSE